MNDASKTNQQLMSEVGRLRRRLAELEASQEADRQESVHKAQVQELCKRILSVAPVWFWAANVEATEIYLASQGAKVLTGYEPEEFIKDPSLWFELIQEEDRSAAVEANERARREKISTSFECRVRHKDGTLRWMYDVVIPLSDDQGALAGVCGFAFDITERKRAEEGAREVQILYEQLVGQAGDAIATLDLQGNVVTWNPGAERMFGWATEEVVGRPLAEMHSYKDPEILHDILRRVHSGETVTNLEMRRIRKDGSEFDALLTVSPIYDKTTGNLVGTTGILKDVTERKQAEEALRALKEFNDHVLQSMPAGLVAHDLEFRITLWNKTMEEISGYTAEEVLGRDPYDVFPHLKEDGLDQLHRAALEGNIVSMTNVPYRTPRGKEGYANEKYFPLRDGEGRIVGVIGIIEDVTHTVRLEKEVAQLQDELESRKLVEVAKGIIMREFAVSEAESYRYIQKKSQDEKRKMGEVARRLIHSLGSEEERKRFA